MDEQIASLLTDIEDTPRSHEGATRLFERARRARVALTSDPEGLRDLAERLADWAKTSEDVNAAAQALIESGDILIEQVGDWEYGVELYERALQRAPSEMAALQHVQKILSERSAWERLEAVLLTHASALEYDGSFGVEERAHAWRRLGQLRGGGLSDFDGAILAYDTAIEIHPDPTWMIELAELYEQRDHADDRNIAAKLYHRVANITEGPAAIPYLERALDHDPHHEEALDMLETVTPPEETGLRLVQRWRAFAVDAPLGEKRRAVVQRLANYYANGIASPRAVAALSRTLSPWLPPEPTPNSWLAFLSFSAWAALLRDARFSEQAKQTASKPSYMRYFVAAACALALLLSLWLVHEAELATTEWSIPSHLAASPLRTLQPESEKGLKLGLSPQLGPAELASVAMAVPSPVAPGSVSRSPAKVKLLSGAVPEAGFAAVLEKVQPRLERCAAAGRAAALEVHGSMVFGLLIKQRGYPAKVRYHRGTVRDMGARLCAMAVLQTTILPKPIGASASVEVTFQIEGQAAGPAASSSADCAVRSVRADN